MKEIKYYITYDPNYASIIWGTGKSLVLSRKNAYKNLDNEWGPPGNPSDPDKPSKLSFKSIQCSQKMYEDVQKKNKWEDAWSVYDGLARFQTEIDEIEYWKALRQRVTDRLRSYMTTSYTKDGAALDEVETSKKISQI